MKKKFALTLTAALLISAASLYAQSSIKVEVPNVVAQDEQFNIMFVIEGEKAPSSFSWEPGDDFQLVWGPQKGTSSSISIVNGKRTSSYQTSYTYILMPKRAGTFTLPKASASFKGDTIYSNEPRVQVVSGRQSQPSQGSQDQGQSRPSTDVPTSDIFLRMVASRGSVVVGEPFTVTLKLFQRANITGFEDVKFPSFTGFWSQETAAPTNVEFHRESLGDMIYNVADLRSWTLIPQQSGALTIDPAEIVCLVSVRAQSSPARSIFDSFFEDDYRTIRKRVTSEALSLKVAALPQGAPSSFAGGVGVFSMDVSLSRDSLKAHDAASLIVTIKGRGNVSLLEAPKISFPPDFESYDVKSTDRTDKSNGRISGSKVFEFPFIPRSHGDFLIPSVEYTYFDINSKKYVTLSSGDIPITVLKGESHTSASDAGTMTVQAPSRKDVRNLGSDVRFIRTDVPSGLTGSSMIVFSKLFWALTLLILLGAALTCIVLKKVGAQKADVVLMKNRGASKMARKRLVNARNFLDRQLPSAFYEELHRALLGYVSDKLNIPSSDMNKDNIASRLSSAGVSDAVGKAFLSLLEDCEFARYSPSSDPEQMASHYESGVSVISSIESEMTSTRSRSHTAKIVCSVFFITAASSFSIDVVAAVAPDAVTASAASAPIAPAAAVAASAAPTAESLAAVAASTDDPIISPRGSADALWEAGCAFYTNGQWNEAVSSWQEIAKTSAVSSPELFCNIGCAYFKMEYYSHAILYFERALKADPSYQDARFDLELAREFVQDRIDEVPEFFLTTWTRQFRQMLSSNWWCILFFVFLAISAFLLSLFVISVRKSLRKTGFFGGIASVVLCVICLLFASLSRSESLSVDYAIMIRPVSSVKSAPGNEGSTDLFILHEGTKVEILQQAGSWRNIELSDGRQGWVRDTDLEII